MRRIPGYLLTIDSPDEDVRRRGRVLAILALAMMALIILLTPLIVLSPQSPIVFVILVVGLAAYAIALALARRGHVTAGGWLMAAMLTLGTLGALSSSAQLLSGVYFLVLPLLVSSLVLRP